MNEDIPVGFLMTLAENRPAMERFSALTGSARQQVVAQAKQADSQEKMQAVVRGLTGGR